jgi:hypothetical protein
MHLPAGARKAALVVHVVTSVGWLGAVAAFLTLAVTAVRTGDLATQRALYISMEVMGYTVLVPLSLASFTSGLVESLGTPWGLLRHWWVIIKLAISVIATAVLLLYMPTLRLLGAAAASPGLSDDRTLLPSSSPVLHSAAALIVLLVAAALSVVQAQRTDPSRLAEAAVAPGGAVAGSGQARNMSAGNYDQRDSARAERQAADLARLNQQHPDTVLFLVRYAGGQPNATTGELLA